MLEHGFTVVNFVQAIVCFHKKTIITLLSYYRKWRGFFSTLQQDASDNETPQIYKVTFISCMYIPMYCHFPTPVFASAVFRSHILLHFQIPSEFLSV